MQFLQNHWGDLVSILGVAVSIVGLVWAIRVARGARSAARAAEQATIETGDRIGRHLVVVDLERAVALIQRLKLLHRDGRWEAALEQYQALRSMLSSVLSRHADWEISKRERMANARVQISVMERQVEELAADDIPVEYRVEFNQKLNETQGDLEDMASSFGLRGEGGGT